LVQAGGERGVLWLSIGMILGGIVGGVWFLEGTTSLDRRLWLHHVRNGLGIGGPIADLPDPSGSGERIQVPKAAVQRYTHRSFNSVSHRFQESLFLAFLVAVAGTWTVTAGYFLRPLGDRRPTRPGDNDRWREGPQGPFEASPAVRGEATQCRFPHMISIAPGRALRPGGHRRRPSDRSGGREDGDRRSGNGQHEDPRVGLFARPGTRRDAFLDSPIDRR
jgi:hypothetical protein